MRIQTVVDLLTTIAGVPNLLISMITILIGSFQNFNSSVQVVGTLKNDSNLTTDQDFSSTAKPKKKKLKGKKKKK